MKQVLLTVLLSQFATLGLAQTTSLQTMKAKVVFQQDSTDLIAMVYQKDTVSVLFKMMFDKPISGSLPADGKYLISYGARQIQFDGLTRARHYAFSIDDTPPLNDQKNAKYWPIVGLARMNPVCFSVRK